MLVDKKKEREIVEAHPLEGARIVSGLSGYEEVTRIIRSHHERLDGKGYPDGLSNGDIPFMARIVAVTDTFDAITSVGNLSVDATTALIDGATSARLVSAGFNSLESPANRFGSDASWYMSIATTATSGDTAITHTGATPGSVLRRRADGSGG